MASLLDFFSARPAPGRPLALTRTPTWTAAAAEVECERTRQIARIGNNLNRSPARPTRTPRRSAQFKTEQQQFFEQQAAENAALRQRIERLAGTSTSRP